MRIITTFLAVCIAFGAANLALADSTSDKASPPAQEKKVLTKEEKAAAKAEKDAAMKAKADAKKKAAAEKKAAAKAKAGKKAEPAVEAKPLSPKEQKLADLLKRYKSDEINSREYHAERAKIIAEP
jgi:hypothetical protein